MDREAMERELKELQARVAQLEAELTEDSGVWTPPTFYTAYHTLAGFVLGLFGAAASLIFNIAGSVLVGQHPLYLIQVYLTFPLGEQALSVNNYLTMAVGCCLYLGTGMVLGIPFQLVLSRWLANASLAVRFVVISLLALTIWVVNFYGILSWLQPLLFGGEWIVEKIPWWVAALTHLVFGWTMLLVQPLGVFVPYQRSEAV